MGFAKLTATVQAAVGQTWAPNRRSSPKDASVAERVAVQGARRALCSQLCLCDSQIYEVH